MDGVCAAVARTLAATGLDRATGIGVGFGGPVDVERGVILRSHHVSAWDDFPLRETLRERFGTPVALDNDANAGALGEARFGAGQGHRHVLYVNVGTGIGAGVILDGRIYHGAHGLAGEIGHVTVERNGRLCDCGKRGCLEAYASGRAIGGPEVTRAAAEGDPAALRRIDDTARWLAAGIGAAVNVLNPSAVVLGGGVSEAGELLLAPLRSHLEAELMPGMPAPEVLPAALGYDAGVIGALALAIDASAS